MDLEGISDLLVYSTCCVPHAYGVETTQPKPREPVMAEGVNRFHSCPLGRVAAVGDRGIMVP